MTERITPPPISMFDTVEDPSSNPLSDLPRDDPRSDGEHALGTGPINTRMGRGEVFVTGLAAVVLVVGFATAELAAEGLRLGGTGDRARASSGIGVNRRDDVSDRTQEAVWQRVARRGQASHIR
jgi:hypothetical protein